ncbi:MAG: hypothetical protein ACYDG2_12820 [Ruminiclostridium sp.]
MNKPSKIILLVKRISKNYKKIGCVISYIYKLLKSSYIRTLVNFMFTFVFAFQMKLADFNTNNIYKQEFYTDKLHILITCVFIVLYNWITILIDSYQKYQEQTIKCVKEIVNRETVINDTIGRKLYDINKSISSKSNLIPIKSDFGNLTYQDIAALVCHNIYDAIKISTEKDTHQVSLMQRFKEKKTGIQYIKMISYGNANQISPSIFDKHFYLDSDQSYYHVKIFNENQNNIFILKNAAEIKKELVYGKKFNENNIVQYIAIPVVCENEGIVSLLQIEITEELLIGRTKEEIREFVKPFMAYIHILTVSYYQDELFKVLVKKFDILKKSKQRREGMSKYEQHYGESNTSIAPKD